MIELANGRHLIRDLGSRNGTYVDGQRVESAWLSPGTVIRTGSSIALVGHALAGNHARYRFGLLAPGLLGSERLHAALVDLERLALTDLAIVIEGATGTGKEQIARAIHKRSGRTGPLVAVNCGAIPESLAEAALFGHRRGAFTGAVDSGLGYVRAADRGTLLLDEVIDLPPGLQTKLLRVLEEGEVVPLGDAKPVQVDVRVVSTVHRPLASAVAEGQFRSDLFSRLTGFTLRVPPVSERREDIPQLFAHFLSRFLERESVQIEPRAVELLLAHPFPLNVRELRLLAHRVGAIRSDAAVIRARDIEDCIDNAVLERPDITPSSPSCLRSARREQDAAALARSLTEHGGNVTHAARAVGISRQRAYRLLGRRPVNSLAPVTAGGDKGN